MRDNGTIVVYRSQAERAIDEWAWSGGYWVIGGVLVAVLGAVAVLSWLDRRRERRGRW